MPPANSPTPESLYTNERAAVQTYSAIPLLHLPKIIAIKDRVHNWTSSPTGEWNFAEVWASSRAITREGRP
jgi:hypothetical protein